jgi:hypothetical protein
LQNSKNWEFGETQNEIILLVAVSDNEMNSETYLPKYIPQDLTLNLEQNLRISRLTLADIEKIDKWLLSFATHKPQKVAFLLMSAMQQLLSVYPDVPDIFYILRVQKLIEEGRLELDGNMNSWRKCEVRLPPGELEWK